MDVSLGGGLGRISVLRHLLGIPVALPSLPLPLRPRERRIGFIVVMRRTPGRH